MEEVGYLCITCDRRIQQAIWNTRFYPNLFTIFTAFIVLTVIIFILGRRFPKAPLTLASIVTGIGLGGFVDGILLHQVLQWHEMLSARVPSTDYVGKSVNMFWDGVFHFFCLVVTLTGVIMMWKTMKRGDANHSGWTLAGGLLIGWAAFNLIEGTIDHHLLKLHNVVELSPDHTPGNLIFLSLSAVIFLIGYLCIKKAVHHREY